MVITRYFDNATDHEFNALTDKQLRGRPVGQIVIRANSSMSWRATCFFLTTLFIVSISVAAVFTVQGYWLILPFSLAEVSIVAACIYYCLQRISRQEVLSFSSESVMYQAGIRRPRTSRIWQRFFTKILIEPPTHPWYPTRVMVQHRQESCELGKHLTDADKRKLIRELRKMVAQANEAEQQHA